MSDDGYPFDDEEPEDTSEDCPECGAAPSEWHDWDCGHSDEDEEIAEEAGNCESVYHNEPPSDDRHPCAKPLSACRWMIGKASSPGETILDPFAGVGSFLVAAKHMYRSAIGIEIDERYCEIAAKRLAQGALPLEMGA